ncbi:MAG: hypothetical protein SCALA702_03240 [Melioribacteraceae bacterium]|nr:MAG: hypothetical protein SCALA702_03240 [Melioribacteraceae bacterium]
MNELKIILEELKALENSKNREGMARFGINTEKAFGVSVKHIREIAKPFRKNHSLALELWDTGYHECRIMASIVAEPKKLEGTTLDQWVADFNSWDVCDQTCVNLIVKSRFAVSKIAEWAENEEEFIRRTAFSMIAVNSVHNKKLENEDFHAFLQLIKKYSFDERNFVKKAVNWALRQIGKRNLELNALAINLSEELIESELKSAKWIGRDAFKELTNTKIQSRLLEKSKR